MLIFLSADLMFASRFHATAADANVETQGALSAQQALSAIERGGVTGVCVDLETPGLDVTAFVTAARQHGPIAIVAYGPHVHEQRLAAAQKAGCDRVLSRGQFDRQLPELVHALNCG